LTIHRRKAQPEHTSCTKVPTVAFRSQGSRRNRTIQRGKVQKAGVGGEEVLGGVAGIPDMALFCVVE
ncbi:hypothetical protein AN948_00455, partial [Rhodococcus sp. ADH]|uniref:hypothetical protein n=1 Tax=Rhodococcus sp. ADH TaxID=224843 RepID=UPI0006CC87AB